MSENKKCSLFLGVHVAEKVLSMVFKDVENMPHGNPNFDFVCNRGKKIDVKASCILHYAGRSGRWMFCIKRNAMADYFLCLAFDDREDLNPLHIWLIPGSAVNHQVCASIAITAIHKWDAYRLDVTKVELCCDTLR